MARAILMGRRQALYTRAPFAIVRPHIVIPRAQRLLPCVTRIHGMNTLALAAAGQNREWMISRIAFFPTEINLTEYTLVYDNFVTLLDGSASPEVACPNVIRVYCGIDRGGVWYAGTFDGQPFVDIPPGGRAVGKVLTLATPTLGQCNVRTISRVNTNEQRPVGYSRNSTLSEAAQWSASDQTALLGTGAISNTASGLYYGPSEIRAKGTTLPVVGIVGNSIDFMEDETVSLADARGNLGAWARALDSTTGGRFAYLNMATQGVRGSNMSLMANRQRIMERNALLDKHTCDFIAGVGQENDSGSATGAIWLEKTQAWVNFLREQYDCKILVRTVLPKSTAGANSAFTDIVNQTPTPEAVAREDHNVRIRNGELKNTGGYFDWGLEASEPTDRQKWKPRAYSGVLVATFTGTSCRLTVAPVHGEMLVFGAGVSGFERSTVTNTTGSAPDVTCTLNVSIVTSRTVASTVKAAPGDGDGTHATTAVYKEIAVNVIEPNKGLLV